MRAGLACRALLGCLVAAALGWPLRGAAGEAATARASGVWEVERGETLYAIARALAPGDPRAQAALRAALLRANPGAFAGGDPGALRAGARLRLPPAAARVEAGAAPGAGPASGAAGTGGARAPRGGGGDGPSGAQRGAERGRTPGAPPPGSAPLLGQARPAAPGSGAQRRRPPPGDGTAPAATVIAVLGKVSATAGDGHIWWLQRGSKVYPGDRIVTAAGAQAQLRFTDGALVGLRPASEFRIDEYHFSGRPDGTERGFFSLVRGGLRTLTGLIGKLRRRRYAMVTPLASIGIRGTDYALQLCAAGGCRTSAGSVLPDGLYGAVTEGAITARTEAGEFAFGRAELFRVADPAAAPQRILEPPAILLRPVTPSGGERRAAGEARRGGQRASRAAPRGAGRGGGQGGRGAAGAGGGGPAQGPRAGAGPVATAGRGAGAAPPSRALAGGGDLAGFAARGPQAGGPVTGPGAAPAGVAARPAGLPSEVLAAPRFASGDQAGSGSAVPTGARLVRAPRGATVMAGFLTAEPGGAGFTRGPVTDDGTPANAILLGEVGAVSNIPSAVVVSDSGTSGGDCHPCTFAAGGATLVDVGGAGGAGLGINWGRWAGDYFVAANGRRVATLGAMGFMYSPNITPPATLATLTGTVDYTQSLGGPTPIDEQGNAYLVTTHSVKVDFSAGQITAFDLALTSSTAGRSWSAGLAVPSVPIGWPSTEGIPLAGACTGCATSTVPADGEGSVSFVGPNAERVMSGFGLRSGTGAAVIGASALKP